MQNIHNKLKDLRESENLTQKEIAQKVDVKPATWSAYENGKLTPSLEVLIKISKMFSVSIDWFVDLSDRKSINTKITTFSDLFRELFIMEESVNSNRKNLFKIIETHDNFFGESYSIAFDMVHMNNCLREWKDVLDLRNNDTLNDKIYNLWKDDVIKENNFRIDGKDKGE